jgi:hypothetical protein
VNATGSSRPTKSHPTRVSIFSTAVSRRCVQVRAEMSRIGDAKRGCILADVRQGCLVAAVYCCNQSGVCFFISSANRIYLRSVILSPLS